MKLIRGIEFCAGSREERLPDFAPDFPYIASRVEMDFYPERFVPWHWHSAVELFYAELAASAYLSERECFRLFRDCLHTTPAAYIRSYRLQAACQMLARSEMSLTEIGRASGLGSSSYFGKLFREAMGCTPSEYRRRWQDPAKSGQDRR